MIAVCLLKVVDFWSEMIALSDFESELGNLAVVAGFGCLELLFVVVSFRRNSLLVAADIAVGVDSIVGLETRSFLAVFDFDS